MMSALNSLTDLKARIEKSQRVSPGLSQEVTDHRTWMEKIRQHGNKPEDWLDFLRFMQQRTNYTGLKRCNFLSPLFEKALKDISDDNRRNEAFAQIFVDFAHLKGEFQPSVVDEMLNYAKCLCKRAAVIYIASAEIKLKLGNPEKAKNVLIKAQNVDAMPADLTTEALHLLKAGHTKLMPRFLDEKIGVSNGTMSNNTTMEHLTSKNLTGSLTCPNSATGNTAEHKMNSGIRSRDNTGSMLFPHLSSAEINRKLNIDSKPMNGANVEVPVCKPSMDMVDHRLGIPHIEPMDQNQNGTDKHGLQHPNVLSSQKTFRRLPELHGLMDPPPDHVLEMDTAPINPSELRERDAMRDRLANSCRPGMRKYSSSPNMRDGIMSVGNYRLSRNYVPLRVPKNLIPEAEKENDDTLSDIKPIEGTPAARSSGHTSGYISMNMSHTDLTTPTPKCNIAAGDSQKSQSGVMKMPAPPRQVLSDISHKTTKRQSNSEETPNNPQCDSVQMDKVPTETEVKHEAAIKREDNIIGATSKMSQRNVGLTDKVSQGHVMPTYNVSHDNVESTDKVTQDHVTLTDKVSHDSVGPTDKMPQDHVMPASKMPQDHVGSINKVSHDCVGPTNKMLHDNAGPSNKVSHNNVGSTNKASHDNVGSTNKVSHDNVGPTNKASHDNVGPTNKVSQDHMRPTDRASQDHPIYKERMLEKMEFEHGIPKRKAESVLQQQPHKVAVNSSSTETKMAEMHSSKIQQETQMIQVNGKPYTVIKVIGQGGSSKVYKVLDTSNFSILALKVVKLDDTKEQIIEGFKNEISLLKRLQYCPRVIQLHDFEIRDEEKRIYILMESGELDLDRHIKNLIQQEGKLSPIDVKYHWRSMLQAVAALHKEGIIHSDLKPSNFLLINGQLKLIDFGIAKTIQQDKTSIVTDCQVGTLNYMSPETIQENIGLTESGGKAVFKIGVKSDVWSLGCILYNMVYGYTPFQKIARQFAKFLAITDPNHVIQFPDIPDENVLDVMKRCLNRDPKQRPSIEELLDHEYLN